MVALPTDTAGLLRRAVLALGGLSIVGIALELLIERHWGTAVRYVPWVALAISAFALYRLVRRPTPGTLRMVRIVAIAVLCAGTVGVALHINENYSAAPLDQKYSLIWDTMSEPARLWAAFTKSVGPAPTFAPAALAEVALLLLIGTIGHPARIAVVRGD